MSDEKNLNTKIAKVSKTKIENEKKDVSKEISDENLEKVSGGFGGFIGANRDSES